MSLRQQAHTDLQAILGDTEGFGWAISVTSPAGVTAQLTGFATDIGQTIDPETGQAVSGSTASVALRIAELKTAGLGIPKNVADGAGKPWVVVFDDIHGTQRTFKVIDSMPDYAIGIVTCMLESYRLLPPDP